MPGFPLGTIGIFKSEANVITEATRMDILGYVPLRDQSHLECLSHSVVLNRGCGGRAADWVGRRVLSPGGWRCYCGEGWEAVAIRCELVFELGDLQTLGFGCHRR